VKSSIVQLQFELPLNPLSVVSSVLQLPQIYLASQALVVQQEEGRVAVLCLDCEEREVTP
jgi:hypothetical protein